MRALNAVIDAALIVVGTVFGLLLVWPAMKAFVFWSEVLQKRRGLQQ